ncbi:DUF2938 domain-containing protein [Pandoraea apista]|uniref:DUF2938 domain-containing protein n=1 Tax=Pandoraea apista TaxID=93218 RepID=A0ABX9ZVU8_9BURK|nr:DUF2938 domain-containing protein [Pandoraea apista]PTE02075.1 DUF2938 domain-containing protein [Pandoraea apista]RSD17701.1 DUF2938 domain-containing protein [Pandoraea apista]RSD24221.1 DUF2938 domain-containing protein [Pandoraea apista]RSK84320.1 DUF2938 domain-containing protein [Pandoraea apista]RSK86409.1 DUF2938 domain-containing protein [Pandoraea apista]
MTTALESLLFLAARVLATGACATAAMDLWAILLRRAFGLTSLDYALVGRWLGHMPAGRFAHASIGRASPVSGEKALGWFAHYAIGVGFAACFVGLAGPAWWQAPTFAPALAFGIGTIVVPFFIMQPAFGAGIAASKTPNPTQARLRSLMTHSVFGLGLYAGGWLVSLAGRAIVD